jgi:hypothetical protein
MKKQEKLQNLDAEQLEVVTGGMDPIRADLQNQARQIEHFINNPPAGAPPSVVDHIRHQYIIEIPPDIRYPLTTIPESPRREAAAAQQWVSGGNPNKRRRTS